MGKEIHYVKNNNCLTNIGNFPQKTETKFVKFIKENLYHFHIYIHTSQQKTVGTF